MPPSGAKTYSIVNMMYRVAENLQDTLQRCIISGIDPLQIVVVEQHPRYPGELCFQVFEGEGAFVTRYREWVSAYQVLNEMFNLPSFVEQLEQDGWMVVFGKSAAPVLAAYEHFSEPLKIEGYDLHPFQQFSLRRAFEADFWFFNWATGAGKSFVAGAGAKELFDRREIDVVIACTVSKSKIDLCRFFQNAGLDAVVNDGTKPKRRKGYYQRHQVYVCNYEKLWVDYAEIEELITGANVLFVFDECHKIVCSGINGSSPNKARRAFTKFWRLVGVRSKVWPMSASVVNGNPLRFRDVFDLGRKDNPLGSVNAFQNRYADEVKVIDIETRTGKTFPLTVPQWNFGRLQEIRHRVGDRTQTARKTDPGLREYFKGMATIVERVQMSREERTLADAIVEKAYEAHCDNKNLKPYYDLLRYTANTAAALLHTEHEEGQELAEEHAALIAKITPSKLEMLNDKLESIREQGDQVLVFTHFTTLTLHLIKDQISVPHVVHYGVGQSDKESQRVKDEFKANPDITCFFTSDAGTYGLNMQNARYVIQYEPTYSYDEGMQRASRIDRSDSHLDGLTNYVFVTEDSVEERVWAINHDRRILSGIVQGTTEVLSHGNTERARRSEAENVMWLIFGERI